ncbi:MAG: radical SAM protein [Candidatus Undinarchaeales archaeon]|nr:radical SAM protein [Candidatus Undinarchaeales archaeon]MDP7493680.1 radical SAM protein [Candidatus Undinarchaeales archaeon]
MTNERALFVNPRTEAPGKRFNREPPIGLLCMGAVLLERGVDVEVLDLSVSRDPERDLDRALGHKPSHVGFTCLTNTFPITCDLARHVRDGSDATVVFGGPHAAFAADEVLGTGLADAVVLGEGEDAIVGLVAEGRAPADVDGVACLLNGTVHRSEQQEPVDLTTLPLPARDLLRERYDVASIIVNRGCPYRCIYCVRQRLFATVRLRPADLVVDELDQVAGLGYRYANLYDNINIDPRYAMGLCDAIEDAEPAIPWGCELRADAVSAAMARALAKAECVAVGVGVESGSEAVLRSAGKHQRLSKVRAGIRRLKEQGIIVQAYFVVGLPGETGATFEKTLAFLETLGLEPGVDRVNFFAATPYPGSTLEREAERLGVTILSREWEQYDNEHVLIGTRDLSPDQIARMLARGKELEAYYRGEG